MVIAEAKYSIYTGRSCQDTQNETSCQQVVIMRVTKAETQSWYNWHPPKGVVCYALRHPQNERMCTPTWHDMMGWWWTCSDGRGFAIYDFSFVATLGGWRNGSFWGFKIWSIFVPFFLEMWRQTFLNRIKSRKHDIYLTRKNTHTFPHTNTHTQTHTHTTHIDTQTHN